MDIEGIEYNAIFDEKNTILLRKLKLKLAVCIYHHPKHYYKIYLIVKIFKFIENNELTVWNRTKYLLLIGNNKKCKIFYKHKNYKDNF